MKKILILLLTLTVFTNCKNDTKPETPAVTSEGSEKTIKQNDGLTLLSGEFSYYADAAVLQVGNSSIYGVVLNDKMHELHNLGKEYRTESTDGILVQVRGKITPKKEGEEGWPYTIDIQEIISVKEQATKNEVIKIGK
ncbi:hypothetical protein [Lacinutrix jangbogonensis]|uniref:hypothetical protein n=1 Tax=Lacinutrix jangbogonensis TaxID=1469557 RepID=UPI00053D3DB3|nr:hypothetical protein [Lacinutrix jangbogonensis]